MGNAWYTCICSFPTRKYVLNAFAKGYLYFMFFSMEITICNTSKHLQKIIYSPCIYRDTSIILKVSCSLIITQLTKLVCVYFNVVRLEKTFLFLCCKIILSCMHTQNERNLCKDNGEVTESCKNLSKAVLFM